jgi:2,4-dienoyl-CoA reductase-like NADH-dependent reductase (Old Yellow Enzyme family)/NADPH-dependent 2,4-dienoyl-CoA reductase/sulfur reductase-like enzyme
MGTELAEPDGTVSDRMIAYYEERARGGAGLVTVEYADVDPVGVASIRRFPPRIDIDDAIPGWRALATAIKRHGARAAVQIGHAGRQTKTKKLADWASQTGAVAPSPVPCVHIVHETPRELARAEIEITVGRFVAASRRAADAGFDAINLHAAHGYLINAFLSPYSNHREDEYGGDFAGRTRFLREILEETRREIGSDIALIVRLSVDELVPGGLVPTDVAEIAAIAERAGADAIDISAAIYDSDEPAQVSPWGSPLASLVPAAGVVKRGVAIPVLVANRIHDPETAEAVLQGGDVDFVCMGRPLLADPHLPRKVREGRERRVRWCISCNECVSSELRGDRDTIADHSVFCTVNAAAGREHEYRLVTAAQPRRAIVVGAGLAGLEAAITLAERGHTVELLEADAQIGGQALLAAQIDHKAEEVVRLLSYYESELDRLGVIVRLSTRATVDALRAEQDAAVVFATGDVQRERADGDPVRAVAPVRFSDVLRGNAKVGRRVVVVGGGFAGADTALYLAHEPGVGREVVLVTRWTRLLPKMAPINRHVAMKEFAQLPALTLVTEMTSLERDGETVTVTRRDGGVLTFVADDVVDAGGMTPATELAAELAKTDAGRTTFFVGGCAGAATFLQAIHGGAAVGRAL